MQTLVINVGGVRYETYAETLRRFPDTLLGKLNTSSANYRSKFKDFFFDRDPTIFNSVLNYYRTGELHLPVIHCGPQTRIELQFWGVDEYCIEDCCWVRYSNQVAVKRILERLNATKTDDVSEDDTLTTAPSGNKSKTRRSQFCASIWRVLNKPKSSVFAKIYAAISVLFVLVAIGALCASTHPDLRKTVVNDKATFEKCSAELYMPLYLIDELFIYNVTDDEVVPSLPSSDTSLPGDAVRNSSANLHFVGVISSNITTANNRTKASEGGKGRQDERLAKQYFISPPHPVLEKVDLVCMVFFTLDFFVRFLFCPSKLRFFASFYNIIDFVSFLPYYVELIITTIRPCLHYAKTPIYDIMYCVQILRISRIFRLVKHSKALKVLIHTLRSSLKEIAALMLLLLVAMLFFSSLAYYTDNHDLNSRSKLKFESIPHAFWWSVITMTTVGYGDMTPSTALGKLVGSFCAVSGVLLVAFTVPSIVNNFLLFYYYLQYRKVHHSMKPSTIISDDHIFK